MGCCQSRRTPTVEEALAAKDKELDNEKDKTTTTTTATTTTSTTSTTNTTNTTTTKEKNTSNNVKVETAANEKLPSPKYGDEKEIKTEPNYDRMDNRISVHVIQGHGLLAGDAGGTSDPYVKVTFNNKANSETPLEQSRTRVIYQNLNPVWNDTIICEGVGVISACESIRFDVWDYDATSQDDFLGTASLSDIANYRGATLPMWIPLRTKKGEPAGELQIQINIIDDSNTLIIRDWTHVLEVTVEKGIELEKMKWIKKDSKPYVRLEWGTQALHTAKLSSISDPHWNEKAFLFLHEERNANYVLQLTIMDDNIKTDVYGQGVISARTIFEHKDKAFEKNVPLTKTLIEVDKALSIRALQAQENADPECGALAVNIKLHLREDIQTRYYRAMVDYFDENKDGQLDKSEVQKFLLTLDIPEDPDVFFRKYDEDANDVWSKEEIVNMLKDYDFQRSPWMAMALEKFLKPTQKGTNNSNGAWIFDGHLMSGVTESSRIGNDRQIIKIRDRHTGLVLQENIPGYVWQALQLMYNSTTGRVFATQMASVLTKMSRDKGREYDNPQSAVEIPHFVELHNLDMNIVQKKNISDYATFNDFFARAIDPDARPLHSPGNDDIILSPADCRMMVFPNIVESTIWVKGSQWTIKNLLGSRYEAAGKQLEGGTFVIARLAPQDYHRFHWPVSGKVTKVTPISGALYTVNPIAINQPINVYTENKRCVIEVDTGEDRYGTVVIVPIGATMVGSYYLFEKDGVPLEEGAEVARGEVCGEFRFGGSTVLLLFEKNRIRLDEDLIRYSKEKLETLIQVRDRIGERVV